ncbi:hypothetical protein GCM10008085_13450 [Winogradskyella epiphytica]|nr:hypothetical protein GCM10008085_13450 [Winogradskyella epiphytica]
MDPNSTKGFLYEQSFLMRLVYIGFLFLIGIVVVRFIIPIDLATVSLFASSIFGTLLGTYLAAFVFKTSEVVEEQSDSIGDLVEDAVEKGKGFIEDLKTREPKVVEEAKKEIEKEPEVKKPSARERLKDKGLM